MTTKDSPIGVLREQAEKVARVLKAAERGSISKSDPAHKLVDALSKGQATLVVAMDDKFIKITVSREVVSASTEAEITEYILAQMREEKLNG